MVILRSWGFAGLALVLAGCGLLGSEGGGDAADGIRSSYRTYLTAVSLKDGDAAAAVVSAATLDHYSGLRDLALTADRATLEREPVVDQLTVLSLRAAVPVETLRTGESRDVVAAAVEARVISAGGAVTAELADVEVTGDTGTALLGVDEAAQEVRFGFRREGETWKVDLTALLGPAEASLKATEKREKLTTRAMLDQVMVERVGVERSRNLWEPLGR